MDEEKILTEEVPAEVSEAGAATPAKSPEKKKKKGAKWQSKNQWKAWLYLLPMLILIAVFTVWPIINTVRMSLLNGYNGLAEAGGQSFKFGFENFVNVVKFPLFGTAIRNTLLLTVITVPLSTMLALLIAVGLNSIKWFKKVYQTVFFLPYVTNAIAIGMVFNAMFGEILINGEPLSVGIINTMLGWFGINPVNWVNAGSSTFANMAVLIIYIVWNALPFKILVLLGGLQSVDKQYYDAAKVDGASRFRIFWRVTVPLLSPMIAYVVITGFIGGFKEYTSVVGIFGDKYMGTSDKPDSMNTMVGLIYDSIAANRGGLASAAALILFAIILAVTIVNLYMSKKRVHY